MQKQMFTDGMYAHRAEAPPHLQRGLVLEYAGRCSDYKTRGRVASGAETKHLFHFKGNEQKSSALSVLASSYLPKTPTPSFTQLPVRVPEELPCPHLPLGVAPGGTGDGVGGGPSPGSLPAGSSEVASSSTPGWPLELWGPLSPLPLYPGY